MSENQLQDPKYITNYVKDYSLTSLFLNRQLEMSVRKSAGLVYSAKSKFNEGDSMKKRAAFSAGPIYTMRPLLSNIKVSISSNDFADG